MCTVRRRQRGVVLVFALLVLLMLGLLVTTVMGGAIVQLHMARSLEESTRTRQLALAEIERILVYLGGGAPEGEPGFRHCTQWGTTQGCDAWSLPAIRDGKSEVSAHVEVWQTGRPPRLAQDRASSGIAYGSLRYEVGAAAGNTALGQGVLVLYPERSL